MGERDWDRLMITHSNWFGKLLLAGEIVVVGGAVVASVVREQFLLLALAVAAGYWPIRLLAAGRLSVRTPADWAIIALLGTLPLTIHISAHLDITIPQLYRLLTGIALYYTIANWVTSPIRFHLLWAGLGVAGVGLALLPAPSVEWWGRRNPFGLLPTALSERFTQIVSDTVNVNVMAGQLVIILPMLLTLLLFPVRWRFRWPVAMLGWGTTGAVGSVLLMSQSRGSLTAFVLSTAFLLLLRWRERWLRVMLIIPIVGTALHLLGWERILQGILVDRGDLGDSLEERIEIWTRAGYILHDFPFTGVGLGNFHQTVAKLYPYVLNPPERGEHAHNIFLQVGADLGVPGLIAWLAVFLITAGAAWQTYLRGQAASNHEAAAAGAGLLGCQLALALHGMVDAVTWGMIRPAPLVWVLWGMAVTSERLLVVPSAPIPQPLGSESSVRSAPTPVTSGS